MLIIDEGLIKRLDEIEDLRERWEEQNEQIADFRERLDEDDDDTARGISHD